MESALEMVGAPKWDRKKYFGALKVELEGKLNKKGTAKRRREGAEEEAGSSNQSGNGTSDDDDDAASGKESREAASDDNLPVDEDDDQDSKDVLRFSALHHDLCPPFIRLPRHIRVELSPSRHSSITTPSPSEPMEVSSDEDDQDEETYLAELQEESKLDSQDRQMEEHYEKELWNASDHDEWDDDLHGMGRNTGHSLKFRKPDAQSGVKSQVYIHDSD
jgi:hypothetical protein